MKRLILGALCGVGLVIAAAWAFDGHNEALGQRVGSAANGGGNLIVVSQPGEKFSMLAVVDPQQQVVGVYSIDSASGKIALRSVRNIRWDLQMESWSNDAPPLPREIRAMLGQ